MSQSPWSPNRCVFSNRLNSPRLSHCRILEGNELHRRGPAVVKHRSPKVLCDRQTEHIAVSAGRSRHMLTSTMSGQSSDIYVGALPLPDRLWKTRTATLNWTRCRTGNQCSCRRISVMWSRRRAPVTSRGGVLDGLYATQQPFRHAIHNTSWAT